jgi:ABC-type bacteriocin/lantibiotic exporter with double-glycine peptidase domain
MSHFLRFQGGQFIQFMSTFIGGFVIAFTKGWLLTVVMLSSIPLLIFSGSMTSMVIAKASSTGQAAYSKSASVVEQTIGSIRTVCTLPKIIVFYLYARVEDQPSDHLFKVSGSFTTQINQLKSI